MMQMIGTGSIENQYRELLNQGVSAIAKLDFYAAQRLFESASKLCPEKQEHRKLYLS